MTKLCYCFSSLSFELKFATDDAKAKYVSQVQEDLWNNIIIFNYKLFHQEASVETIKTIEICIEHWRVCDILQIQITPKRCSLQEHNGICGTYHMCVCVCVRWRLSLTGTTSENFHQDQNPNSSAKLENICHIFETNLVTTSCIYAA